jgi:PhnB protein
VITTRIIVPGAAHAARWCTTVLGTQEGSRITLPGGRLIHLEQWVWAVGGDGGGRVPGHDALSLATAGCTSAVLCLQASDVDAVWARALDAGAGVACPLTEAFWVNGRAKW